MRVIDGFFDLDKCLATIFFDLCELSDQKRMIDCFEKKANVKFGGDDRVDLENARVIFQDDTTVLLVDGKKYVAKPEKGEKYDREKGLLICLLKAVGLTTTDFLNLVKNAEVYKSKDKAVKQDKKKTTKKVK